MVLPNALNVLCLNMFGGENIPLILDILTHIDQRSAAAGARELEQQFERSGEAAGVSFGGNLARGLTGGFRAADFESMTGVLSSAGMLGQAASHGKALGAAFAGGITVAAAAGIVDLGVKVGETFEKINRDITLHTGASGKALEELKGHADALVGSLDSSAQHIGSDMAVLATRLQMTAGPALDQLTKNVEMLRDRMGDFNAGALAGALQNMGVTGTQANDTLASLAQTVQRTDVPLSELATTLAANTELFKDMHLTAGQAGNVIGELSAKGIPATTALMGLQMAMKKTPEGEDFATYIKSVADALDYFGSQGPKGEAAAEQISLALGGPRKWTDLSAAAHAYLDTANQGAAAFAGHGEDLTKLGEQTKTLGNYWDEVKNKISAALAPPGLSVTDEISQKMEELIGFIDAHSTDLRNLFESAISVIEQVVEGLAQVATFLGQHPGLIEAVAVAFGTWEAIKGVNFVLTGIESIVAWLGIEATTAVATGATVETAAASAGAAIAAAAETGETGMLALAATLGTVTADIITLGTALGSVLFTAGDAPGATKDNANDKQKAGQRYQQAHGGQMPPGYQQWLQGEGPMPAGMGPYLQAPGAPAGAPGQPPAGQGTGRFGPGQRPDVGGRAGPSLPGGPVAPGGAGAGDASAANALLDSLDPAKKGPKGPRLPEAPQVPYGAGYGAPPGPGESTEEYSKQQDILEKRHEVDEATARLNQLEQANNATAEDIQKAKNDQLKAISEYNKAELEQTKKHTGDMQEFGAKIDNDFGISKGLSGIAENLTKFIANLAFAPVFGAMGGAQAALGFPGGQGLGGAKGLVGMAGLSGMLGPQFTAAGGGNGAGTAGAGGAVGGGGGGGRGGGLGGLLSRIGGAGGGGAGGPGAAAPAPAGGAAPAAAGSYDGQMGGGTVNADLTSALTAAGIDPRMFPLLQGFAKTEGNNPSGAPTLGFTDSQAGSTLSGHAAALAAQIQNRQSVAGPYPAGASPQDQAAWMARVVGQSGVQSDWQGNRQPPVQSYIGSIVSGMPHAAAPWFQDGGNVASQAPAMGGPTMGSFGAGAVPIMAHEGEHVLTNSDVQAMGGQQGVYQFRAGLQAGSGPQPSTAGGSGATQIGGLGAPKGLGSGYTVTGGGLVGVAESVPATAASMAMAAAAAALHGGAIEDLPSYQDGGEVAAGGAAGPSAGPAGAAAGGAGAGPSGAAAAAGPAAAGPATSGLGAAGAGSSGGAGTGAGGGGAPGGSVMSAAIGIAIQEMNEAISKGGQMAGAIAGGIQQTFGAQQFAQTPLAQNGWLSRIIGGIAGAQPQLPNMGGQSAGKASPEGVPGMTPPQEESPFGPGRGPLPGPSSSGGITPVPMQPAPPTQKPGAPPPLSGLGPDSGGAAGKGADPLYGRTPNPNDITGLGPGGTGPTGGGFNQSSNSGSSGNIGPAVHIENYHDYNSNSSAGEMGRQVEASYSAQNTPGSR